MAATWGVGIGSAARRGAVTGNSPGVTGSPIAKQNGSALAAAMIAPFL
jgi:hypothetical protein